MERDLQDKAFEYARENPTTDEELVELLKNSVVTQGDAEGPEAFEGWDEGRTSPEDHGGEDKE